MKTIVELMHNLFTLVTESHHASKRHVTQVGDESCENSLSSRGECWPTRRIRALTDRAIDRLQRVRAIHHFPGVRYLKPHQLVFSGPDLRVQVPLEDVTVDDVRWRYVAGTLTISAPRYHENGTRKTTLLELSTGYGTWRRRYRLPPNANPSSIQVVCGATGVEVRIVCTDNQLSV